LNARDSLIYPPHMIGVLSTMSEIIVRRKDLHDVYRQKRASDSRNVATPGSDGWVTQKDPMIGSNSGRTFWRVEAL
jgi:hypothetical protein